MITNLSTGATSRSDLTFNSACVAEDGNTYALTSAGLIRLDDSADCSASVTFGSQNFGTPSLKALPTVYAGISAAGRMTLTVTVEGKSYSYPIRDYDTSLQQQRFDLGKGLRGNWYDLTMTNPDGATFEMADITMMPSASSRRI